MHLVREFFKGDRYAAHSGIELIDVSPGHARARVRVQPMHLNGLNIAHGGAIFTLADFAFALAANSHGTAAVAINASITILKAVSSGMLTAEARELARNHRLGTYDVRITDEAGDLVAQFQGLAYRKSDPIPPKD
jgi:acyl-CoA thioesterase